MGKQIGYVVAVDMRERKKLERICRYVSGFVLSEARLRCGKVKKITVQRSSYDY